mmetsp:Transcript_24093/g.58191  ORF Transcript_24093/g.58191 Transcript_24093/m.58191 type:complete len:210 (-) Transcript_24093:500-1129(-)
MYHHNLHILSVGCWRTCDWHSRPSSTYRPIVPNSDNTTLGKIDTPLHAWKGTPIGQLIQIWTLRHLLPLLCLGSPIRQLFLCNFERIFVLVPFYPLSRFFIPFLTGSLTVVDVPDLTSCLPQLFSCLVILSIEIIHLSLSVDTSSKDQFRPLIQVDITSLHRFRQSVGESNCSFVLRQLPTFPHDWSHHCPFWSCKADRVRVGCQGIGG